MQFSLKGVTELDLLELKIKCFYKNISPTTDLTNKIKRKSMENAWRTKNNYQLLSSRLHLRS